MSDPEGGADALEASVARWRATALVLAVACVLLLLVDGWALVERTRLAAERARTEQRRQHEFERARKQVEATLADLERKKP